MKIGKRVLAAILLLTLAAHAEMRIWVNDVGRPIEADLIGKVGERYWLMRPNGEILKARWGDFQSQDQRYLEEQATIAEAIWEAGERPSSWDVEPSDTFSPIALQMLVQHQFEAFDLNGERLDMVVADIEETLRLAYPENRIFRIELDAVIDGSRPVNINFNDMPAILVIETLAKVNRLAYRMDKGVVILEPQLR